jgi:mRNA-degrading endonuclease RelE of RelBE toxin-antitoxin system
MLRWDDSGESPALGMTMERDRFRLRVGDDRVIYARTKAGYLVLRIAHRSEAYRKAPE